MLNSGVDKIHRDIILGHSLDGMDAFYMAPSEDDLKRAMGKYTAWIYFQLNGSPGDCPGVWRNS